MGQEKYSTKTKKKSQLSEKERYKIEAYCQNGLEAKQIGEVMGRDRRTIEREIARGLTTQRDSELRERMVYLADVGQRKHEESAANKGRALKIGKDHELAKYIEDKIKGDRWSPDAIIGHIRASGLVFKTNICTRTLYNYIADGIFAGISNDDLWVKKDGKKREYKQVRTVALNNKMGKSIEERPEEANKRSEIGHWEIDLVVGKQGTKPVILTLVERKTRKALYVLAKNKTQAAIISALRRAAKRAKSDFGSIFKTITSDNGTEFLDSEGMKKAAKCGEIYYAHPYSSWERGSSENGNRILRRFIPKGTDIGSITTKQLQRIEDWVNSYPRKVLCYKSANDMSA